MEGHRSLGEAGDARDVMGVIGSIGVYSTGQQFAWRGMASADFSLTSSLHRRVGGSEEAVRAAELDIIEEARTWGLGTHPLGHVDDLQLLSDLQHFGIPTRLIDVTSNPMTALWFACQPAPSDHSKSGLLLALNVPGPNALGGPVANSLGVTEMTSTRRAIETC